MKKKLVINPLPKIFDYVTEDTRPFPPFTYYYCGDLSDFDAIKANRVDACSLPITKIRQIMDFGTLDDLCEES